MKYNFKNVNYDVELLSSITDSNGRKLYKIIIENYGEYHKYFSSLEIAIKQAEQDIKNQIN
jgi:hypothetical protein